MDLSKLSDSDIQLFLYLNDIRDGNIETAKEILQLPNIQYSVKVLALDRFSRFPDIFEEQIDLYEFMHLGTEQLQKYYTYYNLDASQKYTRFVLLNILKFQNNIIEKPEYKNIHVDYKYSGFTETTHRKDLLDHLEEIERDILECCGGTTVYKFKGDRILNVSLRQSELSYTAYKIFRTMWDSIQKMPATVKEYSGEIYRGVTDISKMPTDFKIGSTFKDEGFSSFSTELDTAYGFLTGDPEDSKMFYLTLPVGLKCLFFGDEYDKKFTPDIIAEYEVVLPAGTTYKIVSKNPTVNDEYEAEILDLELVSTHRPYAEGMLNTDIDEKFDKLIQILEKIMARQLNVYLLDKSRSEQSDGLQQVLINSNDTILDLFLKIMVYKNTYRYLYSNYDLKSTYNSMFKDFFESFEYHTDNDIIVYMYDKKDSKKYNTSPAEFLNSYQYETLTKSDIINLTFKTEKKLQRLFKLLFQAGSIATLTNLIQERINKGTPEVLILNNVLIQLEKLDISYKNVINKVITFKLKNGTYKSLYVDEFFPLV